MESLPLGARANQGLAVLSLAARGWGLGMGWTWPGPGHCRWLLSGCGSDGGQSGAVTLLGQQLTGHSGMCWPTECREVRRCRAQAWG